MQGIPTPTFFGQAGEQSEKLMEQIAMPIKQLNVKPELTTTGIIPAQRPGGTQMAKKLVDRVAYQ